MKFGGGLRLTNEVTNPSKKNLKFSQYIDIKFDKIRKTYHKFYWIYRENN